MMWALYMGQRAGLGDCIVCMCAWESGLYSRYAKIEVALQSD